MNTRKLLRLLAVLFLAGSSTPLPAQSPSSAEPATRLAAEIERGDHRGILSFHLIQAGHVRARGGDESTRAAPPDLRSATKSVTALLVGIAVEQGHIPSLQARVADLLPEYRAALQSDPRKAAITIEHLLTMRSGLDCDDWQPQSPGHEDTMYPKRDWLAFWAAVPAREAPGKRFSYCTGNVVALGAIVARGASMRLDAFATQHLFKPLGIESARWESWNGGQEIDSGGHLRLAARDFARIGELVLAHGQWQDKSVVSRDWVARMTTAHTDIPGRKQRYGYLWWLDETSLPHLPKTRIWMAMGNGGNLLIVMPELAAVAAFTGKRFNQPNALEPLMWLRDKILPGMTPPSASPTIQ